MTSTLQKRLLWILVALLAVKFLLLPWLDWQSERAQDLQMLSKRLSRSQEVIQNSATIAKSADVLDRELETIRARYPAAASSEEFRLQFQQDVSALVTEQGLRVSLFDWIVDESTDHPAILFSRARIVVPGGARQLAKLHGSLESRFPSIRVVEANFRLGGATADFEGSSGGVELVVDAYFRKITS